MSALREIFASFGVEFDTTALDNGNQKIEDGKKRLREFGEAVLTAFAFDKVKDFTDELVEQADALDHAAVATGLSTDELQAWQLGADEADVEAEAFSMSLRKLSLALSGGGEEAGAGAKLFAELGIKTKDATGHVRSLGDVLPEISEHFKNLPDGAQKAALATKLFGRQGTQLIPMLNQGADGIVRLRAKLVELGGGFSPEFIKNAGEVDEQSKDLAEAWKSLKTRVIGFLLPAYAAVERFLTKLIVGGLKLEKGTNAVAAAFTVFGGIAVAQIAKVVAANAPLLLEWGLIAAAIGLAILAVDELMTTWQGGDTLITRAVDRIFGEGTTAKAVGSIKTIKNAFVEFFSTAAHNSDEFGLTWQKTIADIKNDTDGLGGYWSGFLAAMTDAFFATVHGLTTGWEGFGNFLAGMIEALGFSFQVVWDDIKYTGLGVAAALSDAFQKFLGSLGPITDLAKHIGIDVSPGHASEDIASDRSANTTRRVAQAEDILAKIQGTGAYAPKLGRRTTEFGDGETNVTVHNTTNVTVAPGTPGHVAQQVGRAAASGAAGAHRKAAAALGQLGSKAR